MDVGKRLGALALAAMLLLVRCALAEGLYIMNAGGSASLFDGSGQALIIPGRYAALEALGDTGLYAARTIDGDALGVTGTGGEPKTSFVYSALEYDGWGIIFCENGMMGVMDTALETVIEAKYTRLVSLGGDGYLALNTDPLDDTPDVLWRVSRDGGERATGIRLSFGPAAASEGLCEAADTLGRWGYLNGEGAWAVAPQFEWCGPFSGGRAAAHAGGAGLIGADGEWIVQPVYRRVELSGGADRCLAFSEDGAALIDCVSGETLASLTGEDAYFTGEYVCLRSAEGLSLLDMDGQPVLTAPEGTRRAEAMGGVVILQGDVTEERPMRFIGNDAVLSEPWQDLSFAGMADGKVYLIYSEYDTVPDGPFPLETPGTRRYGLLDSAGNVIGGNYLGLRAGRGGLLLAETEDWIGLIRPDGEVVITLDKSEG